MSKQNLLSWKQGKEWVKNVLQQRGLPENLFETINKSNRKYFKLRVELVNELASTIQCDIREIQVLLGYTSPTAVRYYLKQRG